MTEETVCAYEAILKEELVPAMGCTEPIAIAYAAAKCRELLGTMPNRIEIGVSGNIIKNVKSVVVPGTGGMRGIEAAVLAGTAAGKAERKLEVISDMGEAELAAIHKAAEQIPIEIKCLDEGNIFDIRVEMYYNEEQSLVRITGYHTNITCLEKDHQVIYNACAEEENKLTDRKILNVKDILTFAETEDIGRIKELLDRQIAYNTAIAEEGLRGNYGVSFGKVLLQTYGTGIRNRAKAKAAAGSDARMGGCEMPVIINSGSGNQGITASVPVIEYAREKGICRDKTYRALLLSNLLTIHLKTGIGRLSAYCGAVSAGCAAGAAIAYLEGGDYEAIAHTIVNSLAIVSGIVCDGAKASCAAKIAFSIDAGIIGFDMYKQGKEFKGGDGFVKKGVENTIENVGKLARYGMKETDREILQLMLEK